MSDRIGWKEGGRLNDTDQSRCQAGPNPTGGCLDLGPYLNGRVLSRTGRGRHRDSYPAPENDHGGVHWPADCEGLPCGVADEDHTAGDVPGFHGTTGLVWVGPSPTAVRPRVSCGFGAG